MTGFSNVGKASGFAGIGANGQPEGDLTGSYPNPTVVGIQLQPVDPRIPDNGDILVYNGGEWIPTPAPTSTTFFQGTWDANANNPDIDNFPGLSDGYTWIVSVAGNTNLGGITDWIVGDYAVYSNGNWYKLSNSSFGWLLTGNNGTNPTINYVGTADEHDLVLKANNSEVLRLYWTGGSRLSGSVLVSDTLTVTSNITGSNAKLLGDLEVCGGDITAKSAVFNLLNGVTSRINMGNSAIHNWISGSTKFPQGLSGSLTKLVDGTSYLVSNSNISIVTQSNGSVKIHAFASGNDTEVQFNDGGFFAGDAGLTYNKTTDELTVAGDINVNGGDIKTTATTFNLLNSTVTNLNLGGAATAIEIGASTGNTCINNSLAVDGNTTLGDNSSDTVTVNGTTTFVGSGVTTTFAGDVAVNGGDFTTSAASFNLLNGGTTTVNFATAATNLTAGAVGGSTTFRGNITGSNILASGDIAVNGGDITSTSSTFNLLNGGTTTVNFAVGASSALNIGNSAGTNTISGTSKFPQGVSGSLTKLTDGSSYLIAGNNTTIVTGSTGAVTVTAIPSGNNTEIQFNSSGSFAGSPNLVWDGTNLVVTGSILTTGQMNSATGIFGDLFLPPGNIQVVSVDATTITPTTSYHRINATANVTITNTPSINFANATTGSVLFIQVILGSVGSVTFNKGAAQRLALGANTRKLNAGGSLQLIYDGTNWIEMFFNTSTSL